MRYSALLLFVLVSGIAHGLLGAWALRTFPSLAKRARVVKLVVVLLALLPGAARIAAHRMPTGAGVQLFAIVMIEVVTAVIVSAPIVLGSFVLRWAEARYRALSPAPLVEPAPPSLDEPAFEPEAPPVVSRRQTFEQIAGLSLVATTGVALGWGMVRGRHAFQLEEVPVRIKGWPKELDGYTIAQISDIHVGAFIGPRELDEGLELVKRVKPDLVVATGDLVDFRAELAGILAGRLADLPSRDGVVAVIGNHDHYAGAADVIEGMRAARVRVLVNEALRVRRGDGGGFVLVGVDDLQGRQRPEPGFAGPDLERALAPHPPDLPRILLAHQPRYFLEAAGRVALQLSGHTHGGQINPGFRPADLFMKFVAGRYVRDGSTLWVNRGFGIAGPPSRVGAPPEVTKIVIVSA